jgi:plasmid stabilization system protein ParE
VNLRILAEAEAEIESARAYLTNQAARLGDRFVADLQETFDAVVERPESFSKLETLPDEAPYRRALLSIFRYAVIFEIMSDQVLVVALTHEP